MTRAKNNSFIRAISALLLVVSLFTSLGTGALAADKSCSVIYGNANASKTFTVETGNRRIFKSKFTISQSKGKARYRSWPGAYKNHNLYAAYTITYSKLNSEGKVVSTSSKRMTGASCTLKLDCNSTYRITISPDQSGRYTATHLNWGAFEQWISVATWSVKKTKGVNLCR